MSTYELEQDLETIARVIRSLQRSDDARLNRVAQQLELGWALGEHVYRHLCTEEIK